MKYAECSQVEITTFVNSNHLSIYTKDEGKGFDVNEIKDDESLGGNSIKNVKAKAESMNADFNIFSESNR